MGHVGRRVRNGKVIYRVRYRGPDGRERSRNFKRKVDAENYPDNGREREAGRHLDRSDARQDDVRCLA